MTVWIALAAVAGALLVGLLGALPGLGWVFGVVLPYGAILLFAGGLVSRVLAWARVPVPFPIATTCGQQQSLEWITPQRFENPYNTASVIGRMALEILGFRSLLRNTRARMTGDRLLV